MTERQQTSDDPQERSLADKIDECYDVDVTETLAGLKIRIGEDFETHMYTLMLALIVEEGWKVDGGVSDFVGSWDGKGRADRQSVLMIKPAKGGDS